MRTENRIWVSSKVSDMTKRLRCGRLRHCQVVLDAVVKLVNHQLQLSLVAPAFGNIGRRAGPFSGLPVRT